MENIPQKIIGFRKENWERSVARYNREKDNILSESIDNGKLIEIEKWLYVGKDRFSEMENELVTYYEILDLNKIKLNPFLKDEIINNCELLNAKAYNTIKEYYKGIKDKDTIMLPLWFISKQVIQQPAYIIDALKQYPDNLTKEQIIYYRHKSIKDKIQFAEIKFKTLSN